MATSLFGLKGVQFLQRSSDDDESRAINQEVEIEVADAGVAIEVTGLLSGQKLAVVGFDPIIAQHYRDLDEAAWVLSLAERDPVAEPIRMPVGVLPRGFRPCWVCETVGEAEDELGNLLRCANCGGTGMVAVAA